MLQLILSLLLLIILASSMAFLFFFFFLDNINLFFIVLKAGKSKIKLLEDSVPDGGSFSVSLMAIFSLCSHMADEMREVSWGLFFFLKKKTFFFFL